MLERQNFNANTQRQTPFSCICTSVLKSESLEETDVVVLFARVEELLPTTPFRTFSGITAVLGRALAVVKVTSQVSGKTQYPGTYPQKAIRPITIKYSTIDYVGEGNPHTTFGGNWTTGGFSPYV